MNIKQTLTHAALNTALVYISGDPEKNLPKLLSLIEGLGWDEQQTKVFHEVVDNPDNVWHKYLMSLWRDVDNDILKTIFENFGLNASFFGYRQQRENEEKYNCNIPWAILMDPTSARNLHCTGCWAAEYGNKLNLTYEEMDSIVKQANELSCYFFLFSGGEPLVRKADIIRLCEAHKDCQFTAFTNATLIDEAFADEMLRVKNFIPAISVEGFEEATDFRRGTGTFKKVEAAMALLKSKRLPFGVSCCYTSKNTDVIGSEEYFDQMIEWGAKFCWLFTYMPVGEAAVPELMVSAEQREFMYHQVRKSVKPSRFSSWTSGTTENTRETKTSAADVSRAEDGICISTPTATWSPARSSIIPIPTSVKRPCLKRCNPRCSWHIGRERESSASLPAAGQSRKAERCGYFIRRSFHRS